MKKRITDRKIRSVHTQLNRIRGRWPTFNLAHVNSDWIVLHVSVRGFQRVYKVSLAWMYTSNSCPQVQLLSPKLRPRKGGTFEEIPHLMFNLKNPEESALCLFDPDKREWTNKMLIADTTIPWTAEWLYYYELWIHSGVWLGTGVGPESIAQAKLSSSEQT